jgi:acyl carrier protein
MAKNSTYTQVSEIVKQKLGVQRVEREDHLIADLGADSLDAVELVMELEEVFSIEIPDEDCEKMKTVGQIVDYLDKRSGLSTKYIKKLRELGFLHKSESSFSHIRIPDETFHISDDTPFRDIMAMVFLRGRLRGLSAAKNKIKESLKNLT